MASVSVLIPFRAPQGSWRDVLRRTIAPMWSALPVEVVYGTDGRAEGELWSCAAALNDARRRASGDILWLMGCDHIPPARATFHRVLMEMTSRPWVAPWALTHELTEAATRAVVAGIPVSQVAAQHELVLGCEGITVVRADVWDDVGGMDERFEGWGWEDRALRLTLRTLHSRGALLQLGWVTTLWHERVVDWDQAAVTKTLYDEIAAAAEAGQLRQYLREVRNAAT